MRTIIVRLQLTRLWNSEYVLFVNQIVTIFRKFHPELLHLQKAFERLTEMLPQIDRIRAQELRSALSFTLQELDKERDTLLKAITAQVKTIGRVSLPKLNQHVEVLKRFFDLHGRDIAAANYNSATERINNLLSDYDAKGEVRVAVEGLSLKILFDQLREVNTQFDAVFLQRAQEDAAMAKVDTRTIRIETDKILIAFFEAIEFCSAEYEDTDYQTPANELNELINSYKILIKSRTTRRTNTREVGQVSPVV